MTNIREFDDITSFTKRAYIDMTDAEWQSYFNELRDDIEPSCARRMKVSYSPSVNGITDNTYFAYCGETQWQYYCKFINSILSAIRKGERDYCYHIYQIKDLLRFEHDRLSVIWLPRHQCFEVSLKLNQ